MRPVSYTHLIYIPLDELVDKAAETARLTKELESAQKQLAQTEAKLNNPGFVDKAPAKVVEGARQNAETLRGRIRLIQERDVYKRQD